MAFHSIAYIVFLSICVCLYYLSAERWRWCILLVFSCFFYTCWNAVYLLLIVFVAAAAYLSGIYMENKKSRRILAVSIGIIFSCLFVFKYYNFAAGYMNMLLEQITDGLALPVSELLLPVGISFYTFQAAGYIADVYQKKMKAEKNFFKFLLYITFFPQLVAGPIERAELFLPQIDRKHEAAYENMRAGVQKILTGMFKKIVMADTLAVFVDGVYQNVSDYHGSTLLLAVVFFSLQIYGDFSGYSDIATGSAGLFGYQLSVNFRQPYFSTSIKDFWSRWHITLTGWFRDYVYIPLGGGYGGFRKKCRNIVIVFLISGLWHGSAWTFLAWGGVHAVFRVFEEACLCRMKTERNKECIWMKSLKAALIFVTVSILWVFFRAETIGEAFYILSHMFTGWDLVITLDELRTIVYQSMFFSRTLFFYMCGVTVISTGIIFLSDLFMEREHVLIFEKCRRILRWGMYMVMSAMAVFQWLLLHGIYGQTGAFIYFQF